MPCCFHQLDPLRPVTTYWLIVDKASCWCVTQKFYLAFFSPLWLTHSWKFWKHSTGHWYRLQGAFLRMPGVKLGLQEKRVLIRHSSLVSSEFSTSFIWIGKPQIDLGFELRFGASLQSFELLLVEMKQQAADCKEALKAQGRSSTGWQF